MIFSGELPGLTGWDVLGVVAIAVCVILIVAVIGTTVEAVLKFWYNGRGKTLRWSEFLSPAWWALSLACMWGFAAFCLNTSGEITEKNREQVERTVSNAFGLDQAKWTVSGEDKLVVGMKNGEVVRCEADWLDSESYLVECR